jgi:hypothetical protein
VLFFFVCRVEDYLVARRIQPLPYMHSCAVVLVAEVVRNMFALLWRVVDETPLPIDIIATKYSTKAGKVLLWGGEP